MDDELDSPRELPFPSSAEELLAMPGTLSAVALSTDTPGGWYRAAIRHSTPNFWRGHAGRAAAVDHVTDAAWASVVAWFKNPASERSAHFMIRKSGIVDQFVSVLDSAWANGAGWQDDHWIDPQGHVIKPTWPAMGSDHTNPNRRTISIEHEGHPSEPWSAAQTEADTLLLRWLASQYASLAPYIAGDTLIRHADISPKSKPNCPGPLVDLAERAAAANGAAGHYRALAPMWISETPTPRGPVALGGRAIVQAGEELFIDEVRPDGWAHLRSAVGFVPIGGLRKL